ncbi:hypothetical protein VTI74DRAFT_4293 [Chaetomium olivicolor]
MLETLKLIQFVLSPPDQLLRLLEHLFSEAGQKRNPFVAGRSMPAVIMREDYAPIWDGGWGLSSFSRLYYYLSCSFPYWSC